VFDEIAQGVSEITQLSDPTRGIVKIGTTEPVTGVVSEIIGRLSGKYPRLGYDVMVSELDTLIGELRQRTRDVVVTRFAPPLEADDLAVQPLFGSSLAVMAAQGHPLLRRKELGLGDLMDERWTLSPPDSFLGRGVGGPVSPPQAGASARRRDDDLDSHVAQSAGGRRLPDHSAGPNAPRAGAPGMAACAERGHARLFPTDRLDHPEKAPGRRRDQVVRAGQPRGLQDDGTGAMITLEAHGGPHGVHKVGVSTFGKVPRGRLWSKAEVDALAAERLLSGTAEI
jgi:DNA-binding transcriptional LysR family regulator